MTNVEKKFFESMVKDSAIIKRHPVCRYCGGPNTNIHLMGDQEHEVYTEFWNKYRYYCYECLQVEYLVPGSIVND